MGKHKDKVIEKLDEILANQELILAALGRGIKSYSQPDPPGTPPEDE